MAAEHEPNLELIEQRVLAAGLARVKPRRPAALTALVAAAAVAGALAVLAFIGARSARPEHFALAALFVGASVAALWAALRAGTPAAAPAPLLRRALAAAPLLLLAAAAFQREGALNWSPAETLSLGPACLGAGLAAAVPPLVAAVWVLAGGAPVAAWLAGALAGAGAGLMAAAMLHVHCPVGELSHVTLFHGGVVLVAALATGATNAAIWRRRGRG